MNAKLPIDIGVLCDFLDFLCASSIIAVGLKRKQGVHGIELPCSWLARFMPIDKSFVEKTSSIPLWQKLLTDLRKVLKSIYTGVGGGEYVLKYRSSF